jgi:hypothetical protein
MRWIVLLVVVVVSFPITYGVAVSNNLPEWTGFAGSIIIGLAILNKVGI